MRRAGSNEGVGVAFRTHSCVKSELVRCDTPDDAAEFGGGKTKNVVDCMKVSLRKKNKSRLQAYLMFSFGACVRNFSSIEIA